MGKVIRSQTCGASLTSHMEEVGRSDFSLLKRKKLKLVFQLSLDLRAGALWGENEVEGGVKYWDISCCPLFPAPFPLTKNSCVIHILITLQGVFWCLHPMKDVKKKPSIKCLLQKESLCKPCLSNQRKGRVKGRILEDLHKERVFYDLERNH